MRYNIPVIYIRLLIWDTWNVAHIARHQVSSEEVEEVCKGGCVVREGYSGRIILIGLTEAGRVLAIVLEGMGDDVYYVVTARPADRKERRAYREEKGSEAP